MAKTLGIVEIQGQSDPLRSGAVLPALEVRRLGGRSLLDWVVRRVSESQFLDQVVVVCSGDSRSVAIAEIVPPNVPFYSGKQHDPLATFAAVLREFEADAVVRVGVENPFVDPGLIDRLVTTAAAHPDCDYVSYCSADGRPALQSKVGLYAEWCRGDAVQQADRKAKSAADRNDVTSYIYSHPEHFQLRLIPVPTRLDRQDVRLSIQVEEDWDHAQAIYEALGHAEIDWQNIAGLLDHQPAMRERMADLNRTGSE